MYDCTFAGNNVWTQPFLDSNISWNDDGIRVPGPRECRVQQHALRLSEIRSPSTTACSTPACTSIATTSGGPTTTRSRETTVIRNITFYDNRIENSMTLVSFDPLNGGPAFVFRNIAINTGRSPYKFNNTNSGQFIYNNTVVRTNGTGNGSGGPWGWMQFNNGDQRAWGYRNNILDLPRHRKRDGDRSGREQSDRLHQQRLVSRTTRSGGAIAVALYGRWLGRACEPPRDDPRVQHQHPAAPKRRDQRRGPVHREHRVWGPRTSLKSRPSTRPSLRPGTAPRGTGVAIPGITDGYSGSAPDMGAMITGIAPPIWGDRSGGPQDNVAPSPPANLMAR